MQFSVAIKMDRTLHKENHRAAGDFEHLYVATERRAIFPPHISLITFVEIGIESHVVIKLRLRPQIFTVSAHIWHFGYLYF